MTDVNQAAAVHEFTFSIKEAQRKRGYLDADPDSGGLTKPAALGRLRRLRTGADYGGGRA